MLIDRRLHGDARRVDARMKNYESFVKATGPSAPSEKSRAGKTMVVRHFPWPPTTRSAVTAARSGNTLQRASKAGGRWINPEFDPARPIWGGMTPVFLESGTTRIFQTVPDVRRRPVFSPPEKPAELLVEFGGHEAGVSQCTVFWATRHQNLLRNMGRHRDQ